ncbi:hypothetical protein PVK06_035977 [Gossypium arboreum]|uniref:Uncharacterized protein n=1 Tax=Gossypium arboreum TaxID=29729 RepID=A0ABR0NI98_GOSAR|nr:hypothetical protein PVK06_035977 [Gossypium arboreum]
MFIGNYRWLEKQYIFNADGTSTFSWDDYGPYGRQGYDPSDDSYNYACQVESDNQGLKGSHSTYDPYDPYFVYICKDGEILQYRARESVPVDECAKPDDVEVEEETPYTIIEHEGLEVDFNQEIEFKELSEALDVIEEISDSSERVYFHSLNQSLNNAPISCLSMKLEKVLSLFSSDPLGFQYLEQN